MFREMRRIKQALSEEECIEVLKNEPRGVLAVNGENGYPYALPMDFIYIDGRIYFHSAKEGHKLDAIAADDRVSFCVMDKGYKEEGKWSLHIKSVIVFGKISEVTDRDKALEIARRLGCKYYPTAEEVEKQLGKHFEKLKILELSFVHMSGKLVNEY